MGITSIYRLAADTGAMWTLELEDALQGDLVNELRSLWRCIEEAANGARIEVALLGVAQIDGAGHLLLGDMAQAGVEIRGR